MSASVSAYGLAVSDILSMFGSRKRDFVSGLTKQLSADQISILERAVLDGVPFPDLDEEGWSHILLMKRLFEGAPNQTWGDVTFPRSWLMDVINEELLDKLDVRSKKLISYFIGGRPIFGKKFGDTEAIYGYLDTQEVQELNQALQLFKLPRPESPEWDDLPLDTVEAPYSEFTMALTELLPPVIAKKQGLAIYVG